MKDNSNKAFLKEKRYYEKYLSDGKDIYLVGVEFNEEDKNISKFECEKLKY